MTEFRVSRAHIERSKYLFMMFPIIMLCVAAFTLYVAGYKIDDVVMPLIFIFVAAIVFMVLQTPAVFSGMRNVKVVIHDDKIVKVLGRHQQEVAWPDIRRLKAVENSKGDVIFIRMYLAGKKTIYLFGFDDMPKLYNFIKVKMPSGTPLDAQRHRFDLEDPGLPIVVVIILLIILAIFVPKTFKAMTIYFAISFIFTGFFSLIFRPLTKDSLSLRRFAIVEVIIGLLLVAIGVTGFIVLQSIF